MAAQGQVAVHVDVGAVHGDGDPVIGDLRRRAVAEQALGAGAGGDVGTTADRGGAEDGLVGGYGAGPVDGVVQAAVAGDGGVNHAVQGGQQLVSGQSQVQRHDDGMNVSSGENADAELSGAALHAGGPVAGRPFFMVTASMSLDVVLASHLTQ